MISTFATFPLSNKNKFSFFLSYELWIGTNFHTFPRNCSFRCDSPFTRHLHKKIQSNQFFNQPVTVPTQNKPFHQTTRPARQGALSSPPALISAPTPRNFPEQRPARTSFPRRGEKIHSAGQKLQRPASDLICSLPRIIIGSLPAGAYRAFPVRK